VGVISISYGIRQQPYTFYCGTWVSKLPPPPRNPSYQLRWSCSEHRTGKPGWRNHHHPAAIAVIDPLWHLVGAGRRCDNCVRRRPAITNTVLLLLPPQITITCGTQCINNCYHRHHHHHPPAVRSWSSPASSWLWMLPQYFPPTRTGS